jgi:3-oxoacyl-(acyl-carrier-protein) synthase/pimeloyl-ACP methyl ester carboxylesterase
MRRVVVTGIGIAVPSGVGVIEFWRNNTAGRSYIAYEPMMEAMGLSSRAVCRIDDFRLEDHHDPEDAATLAALSRFVQLGTTVGVQAIRGSGIDRDDIHGERAGVIFASAIGGTPEFQTTFEELTDNGATQVRALPEASTFYDSVFLNFTPSWLARQYRFQGLCTSLTTGCTAGIDAVGLGFDLVRAGELDVALCGGAEAPLSGLAYATLDVIGSLAHGDFPPEEASRPFDAKRAGFVLAEGAGALVLEELDHAVARNAPIYGEILGFASVNNAFHMSDLAADGNAMAEAMVRALGDARVGSMGVDYLNAHGSSTQQNDIFETRAIKTVFGDHAANIPISSTKSMIGHSLSSASVSAVISTLGALRYSIVPPTANYRFADPACDLDYVPNHYRAHEVRTAAVTASGFGGIHSCCVLGRVGEHDSDLATVDGVGSASVPASMSVSASVSGPASVFVRASVSVPASTSFPVSASTSGPVSDRIAGPVNGLSPAGEPTMRYRTGARGTGVKVAGPPPRDARATLLFLHGFGGSSRQWAAVFAALPGDLSLFALDLPGHGDSRLAADFAALDAVLRFAEDHDLPEGIGVVGHSLGGLAALDLAITVPGFVSWLGLVATAARVDKGFSPLGLSAALPTNLDLVQGLAPPADAAAIRIVVEDFGRLRIGSSTSGVWGVSDRDLSTHLGAVEVPALVISPTLDAVISPRKTRALAAGLPGAQLVTFDGVGHYAHLEQPRRLAGELDRFSRTLSVRAQGDGHLVAQESAP